MLVLDSWLREFVNPPVEPNVLAEALTMAGLEVEEIKKVSPEFTGVVVGKIVSISKHPQADKLKICTVDAGLEENLQIVCGAPNATEGIKVPLATVGARLPNGLTISVGKLRGVDSFGMLCSASELGISSDTSGLLILDDELEVGSNLSDLFCSDDVTYEIKLTPNRADCLSVYGVAREVSALFKLPLKEGPIVGSIATKENIVSPKVNVLAPDLCGRFTSRVIRGVDASVSTPQWIVDRLEKSGQRSVSVLVDISNYVMLEYGRPTHVFDLDKVKGDLTIDWGKSGEQLKLLNEELIELSSEYGVISSDAGPECLAGIMGGFETSVTKETKNIFIEAAFWYPSAIAGRARKLKLSSEASHRFERGVDFKTNVEHIDYITKLILDICGGEASEVSDQIINLPSQNKVSMRLSRCQKIIGIPVSATEVEQIFNGLGFEYEISKSTKDTIFEVISPSYRFDIEIEEDLIEEVARIFGFDNIPAIPPITENIMDNLSELKLTAHDIRDIMVGEGYQEVINYSFVDSKWEDYIGNSNSIKLLNPIASNLSVMRSSLVLSLVNNIFQNSKRKQAHIQIFEIARAFEYDNSVQNSELEVHGVSQTSKLAAAAWGTAHPQQWGEKSRLIDFYDVKKVVENLFSNTNELSFKVFNENTQNPLLHPGRSALIQLNSKYIGFIGELHPKIAQDFSLNQSPIVFEIDLDALINRSLPEYKAISKKQFLERDLAIWVSKDLEYSEIKNAIENMMISNSQTSLVKSFNIFDVWSDAQNDKEKSIAIKFTLQEDQLPLDDKTVEAIMSEILNELSSKFKARLR